MKFDICLNRVKLLKKCEKVTGFKYDYCFSKGNWGHAAYCFNVEQGIGHIVYFTKCHYEIDYTFTKEQIMNKEFVSE